MTGFENENYFIEHLNNKKFNELNSNLKKLVLKINNNIVPNTILANKIGGIEKADISVQLDDNKFLISIKKGSGNSVHQESIEDFINFLKVNFENDELVFNNLRHFIWGDKTLIGNGKMEDRIDAPFYKKQYPEKISSIQNYFDKYKEKLLERFIITGATSKSKANYLVYGDVNSCEIVSNESLISFAISSIKKPLSIGCLSFQAWNRNINGGTKSEKKRGQIQLKWGSLKEDIKNDFNKNLNKALIGNKEEERYTQLLNQKTIFWDKLPYDRKTTFAIHINTYKYGKINEAKVPAKADIYFATGFIDNEFLLQNNFYLNEDDAAQFNLKAIENSGLSIKLANSEYTILKISPSTFSKIFGSTILGAGASIYSTKDFHKNNDVLKGWLVNENEFKNYFKKAINAEVVELNDSAILSKIKTYSNNQIYKSVVESKTISDFVFKGMGNFDEPYTANWLIENNKLVENYYIPFNVTTGSGRSKGIFTIVFKPK